MTLRLFSLNTHAALEFVIGALLIVLPFVVGFSAAGLAASVLIGALVIGLALSVGAAGERGTLSVSSHHAFDQGLILGLAGGAVVLAFAGDGAAALSFAGIALMQAVLNSSTKYSRAI